MRNALGVVGLVCLAGGALAQQPIKPLDGQDWRRAIVNMAGDPKYRNYKVRIAQTRDGSVWWLWVLDLAAVYKSGADPATIIAHVDASRDKSVPWRRREIQFMVRCADRTFDTPAMIEFTPGGQVSKTDRHPTSAATMAPIDSGSIAESVAAHLCGGDFKEMGEIVPG